MATFLFTDGDIYTAMKEAFNADLDIDLMRIDGIAEMVENIKEPLYWNGAFWNYNGMDIKNQKHPFFDK